MSGVSIRSTSTMLKPCSARNSANAGVILPGTEPGQHHSPDLDGDRVVSIVDLSLFAVDYLISFDPDMDFYCSGDVNLIDFVLFTRHWEHSASIPVVPSTWGNVKSRYLD